MSVVPRFQPIVDVWEGRVIGYEATMRGEHGERAQELLERAKQEGRIIELDFLSRSVAIKAGLPIIHDHQRLFINVTPETLQNHLHGFLEGIPLDRIVLELTEQMPIRELDRVRETLSMFCERGLEIALDDFGRGFSNIEMLTELPISYLKLDKVFASMVDRIKTAETIKWLVRLCQDAGIRLVVEGVETAERRLKLLELGVRYMQGFYFGFPKKVHHFSLDSI